MDPQASLPRKAAEALLQFLVALAAILFASAWSLTWWQGWLFWAVFAAGTGLITWYFLQHDPPLIERRLRAGPGAEQEKSQKIIQALAGILFFALIAVPGLDRRYGWSQLPAFLALVGDVMVGLGLLVILFVFRENSYASSVIEIGSGQKVVSTGPYRLVRHPMYAGALIMIFGIPLALGSAWGLLVALAMTAVIVWRLVEEERFLSDNLPGYATYCAQTPHRLMPRIY
jgi:protein-S-isoprenylcysteine O-methyltransferase Ste14